jgi:hypothetical protein
MEENAWGNSWAGARIIVFVPAEGAAIMGFETKIRKPRCWGTGIAVPTGWHAKCKTGIVVKPSERRIRIGEATIHFAAGWHVHRKFVHGQAFCGVK